MGRGKKQYRTVLPKGMKNEEWYGMFMQLLGDEVDIDIVYPKYVNIYQTISKLLKNLSKFSDDETFLLKMFPDLDKSLKEIRYFVIEFRQFLGEFVTKEKMLEEGNRDNSYLQLKKSDYVKNIIILMRNLKQYKDFIENDALIKKDLKYCERFIQVFPGIELVLFPFSSFELKHLWEDKVITDKIKIYILICLGKFYIQCKKIVDLTLSADVDVKGFSGAVGKQLDIARKQIRGCDKAFYEIKNSLNMLENNFNGYYRDVIRSQNPNILVENFVLDVAKSQEYDAKTTQQFKRILKFYQKSAQGKLKDPKLKVLLNALGKNISLLEDDETDGSDDSGISYQSSLSSPIIKDNLSSFSTFPSEEMTDHESVDRSAQAQENTNIDQKSDEPEIDESNDPLMEDLLKELEALNLHYEHANDNNQLDEKEASNTDKQNILDEQSDNETPQKSILNSDTNTASFENCFPESEPLENNI